MRSSKQAIVSTNSGKLEGDFRKDVYVFKGIPYAEAPVGRTLLSARSPISSTT